MTQEEKKTKEIPGIKKSVANEIVGNGIAMTIIILLSWPITFGAFGPAKGLGTFLGYIACMIPFFTVIQVYIPLMIKRSLLARGKWELKGDENDLPSEEVINLWTLILPRALIYGSGSMLALVVLIKLSGWQPITFAVVLIVLVVVIVNTTLLIKKYLPIDMLAFAKASNEGGMKKTPQPLAGYMMIEHVVPFILLQGYINACIGNRAFHFEAAKAGEIFVPTAALIPDAVITFLLLALFQWMFSNNLTRGDVRLGKVEVDKLKKFNGWVGLGYIFGATIIVGALYAFILSIGQVPGLSVGIALVFKIGIVALSIIFGAWVGIQWGGSREHVEMQE
jgi:hypothetical protein